MGNAMKIIEVPADQLKILMVDKEKRGCGVNTANAGFFATYTDCTLPVGHLTCDFATDDPDTLRYCKERGRFNGDKFRFDNSTWSYNNPLHGTKISTLVIRAGGASIIDTVELPQVEYAVSGVPVMRHGADVKWDSYVSKQGWVESNVRPTWHTFVGLKSDPSLVYIVALETTTANMVKSAEAFNLFRALGFRDVLKLDGGGSFYLNDNGEVMATAENRRINTVLSFDRSDKPMKEVFKLALDAGHFRGEAGRRIPKNFDPGETREWTLNSRIVERMTALLRCYNGIEILRVDDPSGEVEVSLEDRVKAANKWGADFYLSIHHNAGINGGNGGGIVSYAYTKAQAASLEWRDELYDALVAHTGLKGNRATPKTTANHYVTRYTNCPATLLELGFMDSRVDSAVILTDDYAQRCAEAIVKVMVQREGLTGKAAIDVADEWAKEAWEKAYNAGVLDGRRPRDGVTRQELAVVLNKLGFLG